MTDKICTTNADQHPTILFYFDYISPFGWIAAERIGELNISPDLLQQLSAKGRTAARS